ncbi:MAG: attachment glycoprotein G [Thiomicrospira sp.]|uniref:attachment glycoprotein G n=1 Tax=Thiomicrospira sp. TaxID=935 RepID=UPI0019DDB017|nr:attachment glycoprotein G [Thiomicrospira sp.]MBE0494112.1 attachment glycoprotein G [Thiomicrospira sp.]
MQKNTFILALITAISLGFSQLVYAQTANEPVTSQDVKKETQELINTLGQFTAAQRDEAKQTAEQAMKKLDSRIESLEKRIDTNWDSMTQATQSKTQASLNALRQQRNELAEWYKGFMNSSSSAWDDVKKGFSDTYQSINDALEKTKSEHEADSK